MSGAKVAQRQEAIDSKSIQCGFESHSWHYMMNWIIEKFWNRLSNWYWRTRYRYTTPSNRLKIRNVGAGWVDRNDRLFHANFTILCDFIEQERDGALAMRQHVIHCKRQARKDPQDVRAQFEYQQNLQFLRLYRWYVSINWNEPVELNPEYANMLKNVEYVTTPTDHGTYKIESRCADPDALARHRAIHATREQQFEKTKMRNLRRLVKLSPFLWT
jgi:hypothetical protein